MLSQTLAPTVRSALIKFEESKGPSAWKCLDKNLLLAQIKLRLQDPFLVNQGKQAFCGPAAILFELVRTQPLRYLEICRSIYETGGFEGTSVRFKASEKLRHSECRQNMNPADWMILTTLRESENRFLPVEADAPEVMRNLAGLTKSWQMKGWAKEVLGYSYVKYCNTYLYGEWEALQEASEVIASGGVAFALITSQSLFGKELSFLPSPNHWLSIMGNISIQDDEWEEDNKRISLDVYSWGQKLQIDQNESLFEDYFWGVILGSGE